MKEKQIKKWKTQKTKLKETKKYSELKTAVKLYLSHDMERVAFSGDL